MLIDYWIYRLQELTEQFEQLKAHNEGKNIFKMAITPIVLGVVILLGYLWSMVCGAVGVASLEAVGHMVALTACAMLLLWVYSR